MRLVLDEGAMVGRMVARARSKVDAARIGPIFADYLQQLSKAFGSAVEEESAPAVQVQPSPIAEALTPKEVRLLQLLAEGYSNRALTEKLFISDSTVRTHLRNINIKLGANSRTQAVAVARRMGLIR